jgi:DNA-binding transcriptional regulator YiaG
MTDSGSRACEIGAAVHRHPAAGQARADLVELELARRVAASLRQQHAPWPAVAAAALAARGAHRLSRSAFATRLGVDPDHLAAVETGQCAPVEVPLPLQRSDRYGALLAGLERTVLAPDTGTAAVKIWHEDRPP